MVFKWFQRLSYAFNVFYMLSYACLWFHMHASERFQRVWTLKSFRALFRLNFQPKNWLAFYVANTSSRIRFASISRLFKCSPHNKRRIHSSSWTTLAERLHRENSFAWFLSPADGRLRWGAPLSQHRFRFFQFSFQFSFSFQILTDQNNDEDLDIGAHV